MLVIVHELEEAVDLAFELLVATEVDFNGDFDGVDVFDGGHLVNHVDFPAQILQILVQVLEPGKCMVEDDGISVGEEVQFLEEAVEGVVDGVVLLLLLGGQELKFGGDLLVEGVVLVVQLIRLLIQMQKFQVAALVIFEVHFVDDPQEGLEFFLLVLEAVVEVVVVGIGGVVAGQELGYRPD